MYDKIEEIYELTYEIFEFNRYKITKPKDDSLLIELNYNLIVDDNNKFKDNIQLEMKQNTNGDFSRDYNYILNNLKNKYNRDISEKKKELFDLKKEKTDLHDEKYNLNKEISNLKKVKFDLTKELSEIKKEFVALTEEKNNLKKEKANLNIEVSNLRKEISDLKTHKKKLSEDLKKEKQMNIKNLSTTNKKLITMKYEKPKKIIGKDTNLKRKKLEIQDIKKLENYPDLEKIIFINYGFTDISILNKFTFEELKELNFSKNLISNINVFKDMKFPKLNEFILNNNKITDLEPLSQIDLTNIQTIDLSFNCIDDINVFYRVNVPHLKYLNLSNNNIKEITIFSSIDSRFTALKELYLNNNQINQDIYSDLLELLTRILSKFNF